MVERGKAWKLSTSFRVSRQRRWDRDVYGREDDDTTRVIESSPAGRFVLDFTGRRRESLSSSFSSRERERERDDANEFSSN